MLNFTLRARRVLSQNVIILGLPFFKDDSGYSVRMSLEGGNREWKERPSRGYGPRPDERHGGLSRAGRVGDRSRWIQKLLWQGEGGGRTRKTW